MKSYFRLISLLALLAAALPANAYDFMVGGLCYVKNSDGKSVTVTYQNSSSPRYSSLSGALYIPSSVTYSGKTYSVTSIGSSAFCWCHDLSSVTIPNSVTSIGSEAFTACSGLTSVTIPNSVTSIGRYAFNGCSGLKSVTIGNSVTSIGNVAFQGCNGLTSVTWNAKSCNDFSYQIFNELTNIKTFEFGNEVEKIPAYLCSGLSRLTSVTIPNSVTSIGDYSFYDCSRLTSVTIPNSVTSIGNGAFTNCSGLTSVTIPNSVTSIGYTAFSGCSGLTSVTIPNSVTSIGQSAFSGCCGLTSVTIPNSVTSIGSGAFQGCSGLTSMTIPNSVKTIDDRSFQNCSGLTSVTIPNSVTYIGQSAFSGCCGLTSVTIPNSVTSIGHETFSGCSNLTSVTWNAKACNYISDVDFDPPFYCLSNLMSFEFGNEVETIPEYLCDGLSGLTSVTIPNSVTSIGNKAFVGCSGLTSVTWNAKSCNDFKYSSVFSGLTNIKTFEFGNDVEKIPAYLCYGLSRLTSVTIPNSVTSIGEDAFNGCTSLRSVTIGNSVTEIGWSAFFGCSGLTGVYISDLAKWCEIAFDNDTANPLTNAKHLFVNGEEVIDLVIPNTVTRIDSYAFVTCVAFKSATIPNSVTSIGNYAFSGCSGLASVTIGNSVTSIGQSAFSGCRGLTSVTIPNSVNTIGGVAFQGCSGLTSIKVNDGNTKYDSRNNCNALIETATNTLLLGCKNTVIPNSVTSIGEYAFYSCEGLTSVTIPNSVTSIGSEAFTACSGLTSVTIPNSVTSIGNGAFTNCSGLTSVTIPNSITSIGYTAFSGCSGLTSVTIPNSVTSIGYYAFLNCSGLTDIYSDIDVPSNVTMGANVFNKVPTSTCVLHVPVGTTALYRTAAQWNVFTNIVEHVISATSIALDRETVQLVEGETATLTATVLPEDAANRTVAWSSSNESVATVDANGTVTAVAAGTATITATTTDGSDLSASCAVTVIAQQLVNELSVADYRCMAGDTFTIDVSLSNGNEIGGVQFDLYLPEGFSVALDNDGKPDITLDGNRSDGHQLMVNNDFADGHLNVLAFSMDNEAFVGNDGAVIHINVVADNALAGGDYVLELRDIELAVPDGSDAYNYASLTSTITVMMMGDANADGRVTVSDVLIVARRANGYMVDGLNDAIIDMNGDGRITVSDLLIVANISNNGQAAASGAPMRRAPRRANELSVDNHLAIADVTCDPGERFTLPVEMVNPDEIGGFMFDLYLPEGFSIGLNKKGKLDITLEEDRIEDHMPQFNNSFDDGHLHVQAFSMSNEPFYGNEGPVVYIAIVADDNVSAGIHTAAVRMIELSSPDGMENRQDDEGFTFDINVAGGLTLAEVLSNGTDGSDYSISSTLAVVKKSEDNVHAYVTDGEGNWARLEGDAVAGLEEGAGVVGVAGTLSASGIAPTITLSAEPVLSTAVPYEIATIDLSRAFREMPMPCQVVTINGFFDGTKLRAYRAYPQGQGIAVDLGHSTADLEIGKKYIVTAAIELLEPWENDAPNGAPARIKTDDSNALDNLKAGILESQLDLETGIVDLAADDGDGLYYNLLGVPVQHPTPGIYIHNGKKVVVK